MPKFIFYLRFYRINSIGQFITTGEFKVFTFRSLLETFKFQSVHYHCFRILIYLEQQIPLHLFSSEIFKVRSVASFKRIYSYSRKRAMVRYFEYI